jgi:hypothetical protein
MVDRMKIKEGSKWSGSNGRKFHVIHVVELDGHTWVHYIDEQAKENENREYSCYIESFLSRFTELPE